MEKKPGNYNCIFHDRAWINYSLFLIAASIMSAYFTGLRFALLTDIDRKSLFWLMNGSFDVPFQYRMLIPTMVKFIQDLNLPLLGSTIRLYQIIEFLSTFFLFIAYRSYLRLFIRSEIIPSLFSLSLLYVLLFNYILYNPIGGPIFFSYDVPSVLFFTLGLILIYRKNWFIYYPVFILATFNRETTIFLTLVYLFTNFKKDKLTSIVIHVLFQVILWLSIKKVLAMLYAGNPGPGVFLVLFSSNISRLIGDPRKIAVLASSFGFIWVPVVYYFRLIPDSFVKRSLLVAFPFFAGMFIVANIIELRLFGELIPIVFTAFLLIVYNLIQFEHSKLLKE